MKLFSMYIQHNIKSSKSACVLKTTPIKSDLEPPGRHLGRLQFNHKPWWPKFKLNQYSLNYKLVVKEKHL